jgi:hypothetical protein
MTVARFVLFAIRLILYLLFSPFMFLWILGKVQYCRLQMIKSMTQSGMPKEYAREIAKDVKFTRILKQFVA